MSGYNDGAEYLSSALGKGGGCYGKFRCMLIFIGSELNAVRNGRPLGM